MEVTRRKFIKDSCSACLLVLGAGALASSLSGCASLPVYKTKVSGDRILVPLSSILPEEKLKIVRTDKLDYDILLVISPDKSHRALLMMCTHIETRLSATKNGLMCNLHGSSFNLDGEVKVGPAINPLKKYRVIETAEAIEILLA